MERWRKGREGTIDKRAGASRPRHTHALSEAEIKAVLEVCHADEFSSSPPGQIVPTLADRGVYLASESTFYRILRKHAENNHRARSKAPVKREPPAYPARAPLEIWVTDISWLRGPARGVFFFSVLRDGPVLQKDRGLGGLRERVLRASGPGHPPGHPEREAKRPCSCIPTTARP